MTRLECILKGNRERLTQIRDLQRSMEAPCVWCDRDININCDECSKYKGFDRFIRKPLDELLPCLKCGVKEVEITRDDSSDYGDTYYRCQCSNGHSWDAWCDSEEEAIESWNERPE